MAQTITEDKAAANNNELNTIPTRPGYPPVADINALLAGLPRFTDEEVKAVEEAIAEDRAQRRVAAGVAR